MHSTLIIPPSNSKEILILPESVAIEVPLDKKIALATVEWVRALNQAEAHSKEGFKTDKRALTEGVWYPFSHWKAVESIDQAATKKLMEFLAATHSHVCGFANRKFFQNIPDFTSSGFKGYRIMHFVLKDNVLPTDAIKSVRLGLSIIDCGMACQIARYGALLEVLGEKKFNILFGNSNRGQKMNIGYLVDDHLQPMKYFVRFSEAAIESVVRQNYKKKPEKIQGEMGNRPVKVGELVEIRGVATHRQKHPWTENAGYNLICSDDTPGKQRFIGLGTEGTEEEIVKQLVAGYNKNFQWSDIFPGLKNAINQAIANKYKDHQVTGLDEKKDEGFNSGSMQHFNLSLIQDLIDLPEEQVSMAYVRNHPCHNSLVMCEQAVVSKVLNEA
jgi:hypothetical protein